MVSTRRGAYSSPPAKSAASKPPRTPRTGNSVASRDTEASVGGESRESARRSRFSHTVGSPRYRASKAPSLGEDSEDDIEDDTDFEDQGSLKPPPQVALKTSASVGSDSSATKKKLPYSTEKQLLTDIEEAGGLHFFGDSAGRQALSLLLNKEERKHLYGERGDKIRIRISRRIHYLKNANFADYCAILESYGITPAKLTPAQRNLLTKKQKTGKPVRNIHTRSASQDDSIVSDLEEFDEEEQVPDPVKSSYQPDIATSSYQQPDIATSSLKPAAATSSFQPEVTTSSGHTFYPLDVNGGFHPKAVAASYRASRERETPEPRLPQRETVIQEGNNETMTDPNRRKDIYVDPTKPWDCPEDLLVCPFQSYQHSNNLYDGIELRVTGDPRDIAHDRYKLEAADRKPSHHFKFTKPALAATHHEDRGAYCGDADTPECSKLGYQVAMQSYSDAKEDEKKKTFDVYFPSHMKLTDAPFVPQGEEMMETEVFTDLSVVNYKPGFNDKDGNEITNHTATVVWRLVDMGTKRKLEAEKQEGPKGLAAIQKKMQRGMAQDAAKTSLKRAVSGKKGVSGKKEADPVQHGTAPSSLNPNQYGDLETEMLNDMDIPEEEDDGQYDYDEMAPKGKKANNPWGIDYDDWAPLQRWVEDECRKKNQSLEAALDPLVKWCKNWAGSPENIHSRDWDEVFLDHLRQAELEMDQRKLQEGMAQSGGNPVSSLASAVAFERRDLFKPPLTNQKEERAEQMSMRQKMSRAAAQKKARNSNNPPAQPQEQPQPQADSSGEFDY